MPATYEPIATTTLGSAAASISFSSISSAYTDLRLVMTYTCSTSSYAYVTINSDTGTNYSRTQLSGNGTAATSIRGTSIDRMFAPVANTTTTPVNFTADFFSYAGSTNKTSLWTGSSDQNGSGNATRTVYLWRSTSAISSLQITSNAGNFEVGTSATLYGILKA
jgi:hypothetical protein